MKKAVWFLILLPVAAGGQVLSSAAVGAQALGLPADAAASGLGGAFTSLSNDASALYWNPAGMAFQRRDKIQATYNKWLMDISYQDFSALLHVKKTAVGARLTFIGLGQFELRDEFGVRTGETTSRIWGVSLGAARRFGRLAFGFAGKIETESLAGQSLSGYAFDMGTLLRLKTVSFSLGCRNIGSASGYSTPRSFYLGSSCSMGRKSFRVRLATDAEWPSNQGTILHHGLEAIVQNNVCFRAGYQWAAEKELSRESSGFGGGFGFQAKNLGVDYSIAPFGELGLTHKITLTYMFGGTKNKKK